MAWKLIRLDLARTAEYPEGSANRCYPVRLSLDGAGVIGLEEEVIAATIAGMIYDGACLHTCCI